MIEYLAPVLTFLGGLLVAWLTAVLKFRKDLEAEYDKTLRAKRMKAYEQLWATTQPLAFYARAQPATPEVLQNMAVALRNWYYEKGGIYLTQNSKEAYFSLQDGIVEAVKKGATLEDAEFDILQKLGSELRGNLADDVGARRKLSVTEEKN